MYASQYRSRWRTREGAANYVALCEATEGHNIAAEVKATGGPGVSSISAGVLVRQIEIESACFIGPRDARGRYEGGVECNRLLDVRSGTS